MNRCNDNHIVLRGKIDQIDLSPIYDHKESICIVIDYKSSAQNIDPVLLAHGVQLQLPAYLSVLRHVQRTETMFGVARLLPAGLFYVNLRGQYERGRGRKEVLEGVRTARANAYRHSGRFDS